MCPAINFDVNRGFDQLNELAAKLFGDGNSVVFEIGNLTEYPLKQGRSVFLAPAAYVETNDALPGTLAPNTGIVGAYSTRPGTGYSLRVAASFAAPGATLLLGCDVNPVDIAQRWASGYAQNGVDVASLSDADLGEFVGTQPGDTWPKAGEVIPGWDVTKGGVDTATAGGWTTVKTSNFWLKYGMDKSEDSNHFSVRAFVCPVGFDQSVPGESAPIP